MCLFAAAAAAALFRRWLLSSRLFLLLRPNDKTTKICLGAICAQGDRLSIPQDAQFVPARSSSFWLMVLFIYGKHGVFRICYFGLSRQQKKCTIFEV